MKVTLKARNLRWRDKEHLALTPINFTVKEGEIFGLFGDTESKNAEVVKILAGSSLPVSGSLTILDTSEIATVRHQIGSTFDILGFRSEYSIEKNIKILCMIKEIRPNEAVKMLRLFDLWDQRTKTLVECSPEQKKRMAIICALIGSPDVVLLNRPLQFLSRGLAIIVCKLLKKAAANGQTVFITDNPSASIAKICTQILELEEPSTMVQRRKIKKAYLINKKAS
ncbi:MAG: ATP-binding cassette domain-containing protein [Chitinophagales bacterium]